ncbi:zinc ABC transporter substrate-binding protein [uncultured Tateyamaria sp.]|uniref:zinc ABC transporter substrate-binding protein n=1 Tax=uncultured Tateyamaria sp. TaxID=455651 RepID=UPI002610C042|nr:zinc ABC transporter substrate-binding protein [uncultured Tateyamaria sp.]
MSRKLAGLSVTAILAGGTALADVPKVAVDIAPVHALVARVMQGVGTPDLVIRQGASPHEYSLRPSEAAALQNAQMVFWIGSDLTPWLADAVGTLAADATVTSLLEVDGTITLDYRDNAVFEGDDHDDHDHDEAGHDDHAEEKHDEHEHDEHGHDDHADHKDEGYDDHGHDDHAEHKEDGHDDHGHDEHAHEEHAEEDHEEHAGHDHGHHHGDHDPHAWLSPRNAVTWIGAIADQLAAADPDNADAYRANAAAARTEMDALVADVNATLAPVRGKSFVVFHDAYQYFEADFNFPALGAIALSDAKDPSPARIAEIQGHIAEDGVTCVLAEPQFNPGLVATVTAGTTTQTGILDPLGSNLDLGPAFYPQLINSLADALAECL